MKFWGALRSPPACNYKLLLYNYTDLDKLLIAPLFIRIDIIIFIKVLYNIFYRIFANVNF
jgi:hypothetical protein